MVRVFLWNLLALRTARKALALIQREGRKKRGGDATPTDDDVAEFIDLEPTPEFAAQAAEEFQALMDRLPTADLRQVALLALDGYSNNEIADRLDVVSRTVERKLATIRKLWKDKA